MLNADLMILEKRAAVSGPKLSDSGRDMVTYILVTVLADIGAGVASVYELKRMAGEQNINPTLAERLAKQFKKEKGLKVTKKYMNDESSPGPHFDPTKNRPHGRIGGPDAKTSKKAVREGELSGRTLSLDAPEIRLHELGHARSHAKKNWSAQLYGIGPLLGNLGGMLAGMAGKPGLAALISLIGESPRLLEEWRASAYAKKVLKANLPEEEAAKAFAVLNRAFRTYLYGAAAATASSAAYGWITKQRKGS